MKSNMASKMAAQIETILKFFNSLTEYDGRRIFFWFNAASMMGVYLENEYFTWY